MRGTKITWIFLLVLVFGVAGRAQTVFTYRSAESELDRRYDYEQDLLELALEKTVDEYGPYEMVPSPKMNFTRAYEALKSGNLENPMFKTSVTDEFAREYDYVSFPVDLGIVGYRVCFTHPDVKEELAGIETLAELKEYTIGQGSGWVDVQILEHAGFQVQTVSNYESLFKMVTAKRFDLFPRGANEVMQEYPSRKEMENLVIDDNICIFYPMPRFFFTTKGNTEAVERVETGIKIAYEDGSFRELWNRYYLDNIKAVNLNDRKIFTIENPFIKTVDPSYKEYLYDPAGEN